MSFFYQSVQQMLASPETRRKNISIYPKAAMLMNYIITGAIGMKILPLCEGVETEEQYVENKDD